MKLLGGTGGPSRNNRQKNNKKKETDEKETDEKVNSVSRDNQYQNENPLDQNLDNQQYND